MRKLILFAFVMATFGALNAQVSPSEPSQPSQSHPEVLKLKETEHDFGKIPQGKPVYYSFEITNTGATALKLDNVQASCGCTTPEWSQEPIAAHGTAKIKVGFNAGAEGPFEKAITITYNGGQTKIIKIKGLVWKAPEGSAPVNPSIDLLKNQSH